MGGEQGEAGHRAYLPGLSTAPQVLTDPTVNLKDQIFIPRTHTDGLHKEKRV
jgi:hypothetical protein